MSNDTTIPLQENSEIRETEAGRFHSGGYEARVYATSPGRIAVQIRGRGPLRAKGVERSIIAHGEFDREGALALHAALDKLLAGHLSEHDNAGCAVRAQTTGVTFTPMCWPKGGAHPAALYAGPSDADPAFVFQRITQDGKVDVETWHATFGDALIQVGLLDW